MWVLKLLPETRKEVLRKMMFIKSSSVYYPKEHNVILKEDFEDEELQKLIKSKNIASEDIQGALKPKEIPDFLKEDEHGNNEISRCLRYAIFLSNIKPFSSCILTSPEKEKDYITNEHYKRITTTVIIKYNDNAISIIDKLYNEFVSSR